MSFWQVACLLGTIVVAFVMWQERNEVKKRRGFLKNGKLC